MICEINMKVRLAFLFLFFPIILSARSITGRVVDSSDKDLPGAVVELLSPNDSSVIRSTVNSEVELWGWKHYEYRLDVDNNTTYLLRVSMLGFKTVYKKVEVKMADRVAEQWVPDIKLEEDSKTLSEVVVKATKIKMVMNGDTIVYNADAFNLSEGSMLDALINQLPGATLENGVIKVNGRTVSSLLIDGRDFFNGDAKKALANLPAYTVDKIKVYDKAGRESRFMQRDMGDKALVLDVDLKKQYRHGNISNVDIAGGTHDRYMARLFSMFYGSKSRLTIAANFNNINNEGVPGQYDAIGEMPTAGGGLTSRKEIDADYHLEGKQEDDYFDTSNNYSATDDQTETCTNAQTFLTGGDYYNLSINRNCAKNYTVSSDNSFGRMFKKSMLYGNIDVSHTKSKGWGNLVSGRFNAKPWGMSALDSIFSPNADRYLMDMLVNRVRNDNQYKGHSTNYSGSFSQTIKLSKKGDWYSGDTFGYSLNGNYNSTANNRFALNLVDYLTIGTSDNRDQYSESPNKQYNYQLSAYYTHFFVNDSAGLRTLYFRPTYSYSQNYSSQSYGLYRLDQLAGYGSTSYAIGVLPSTREALLSVRDGNNSYRSEHITKNNNVAFSLNYIDGDGVQRPRITAALSLNASCRHESLDYYRQQTYYKSRNATLLSPSASFMYQFNDSTGYIYTGITYSSSPSQPSLESQLDIRDDANPLVVTLGNPGLKNSRTHNVSAQWSKFGIRTQTNLSFSINYTVMQYAIATATLYDKQTGVTTTQRQNINGNWSLGFSNGFQRPVDKKQRLMVSNNINVYYNNSVDLTTVEGVENKRSDVHNWNISMNPSIQYQIGDRLRLSFTSNISYQRATSERDDFTKVSAWNYNFGLRGNVKLPWSLELSTDFTNYNRRGYNDDEMNTSEWIWNARLTRSFIKRRLTLSLDAFDILGQLKSTTFTLNSQGRTEEWTNSLPRYAMLHVAYKFNFGKKME